MIVSLHIADLGLRAAPAVLRAPPPGRDAGAYFSVTLFAADLRGSVFAVPSPGRLAIMTCWAEEAALDSWLSAAPLAQRFAGGWHARFEPVRISGSWPGLPTDLATEPPPAPAEPSAALTIGRLRLSQAIRFRRASAKAEADLRHARGLRWASGLARPPLVMTCSLWDSTEALTDYAYRRHAHRQAITSNTDRPFHHRSAFLRLRPTHTTGTLANGNPLATDWAQSTPPPG